MDKDYDYKKLSHFKWFVLQNFPFIDEDFDAITNYQLFCKLGEEINKLITSTNSIGEQLESLTDYVVNYFENLDVTEEINDKLDEMADDGTLGEIMARYLQPIIDEQNRLLTQYQTQTTQSLTLLQTAMTNLQTSVNSQLSNLQTTVNNQLDEVNNDFEDLQDNVNAQIIDIMNQVTQTAGSIPVFVNSTDDMIDSSKIYVLKTDSHIYYYSGTTFVDSGLTYGASVEDYSVTPMTLSNKINSQFSALTLDRLIYANKGGSAVTEVLDGGKLRVEFDSNNAVAGQYSSSYICVRIPQAYAPKIVNNKLDKNLDVCVNIESNYNYDVILAKEPGWASTTLTKSDNKKGLKYYRFSKSETLTGADNTVYNYIILKSTTGNIKGFIEIYIQNDVLNSEFNIEETIEPFKLSKNFIDNCYSIPLDRRIECNRGGTTLNTKYDKFIKRIEFDSNNAIAGTGTTSYVIFRIPTSYAPKIVNNKLDKIIDCIVNVESDDDYDIMLSREQGWGNDTYRKNDNSKGINYFRFNNLASITATDNTVFQYIILRCSTSNVKGSITVYMQNDFAYNVYNKLSVAENVTNYNFIGDSLTAQGYSNYVERDNKRTFAVGGEGINAIYERTAIEPLYVLNNQIVNGDNILNLSNNNLFAQGMGNINPVTIAGIKGTLSRSENQIHFTPTDTIETTAIYKPTIIPNNVNYKGVNIIWAGTNNINTMTANNIYNYWKKALEVFPNSIIVGLHRDTTTEQATKIAELDNLAIQLGTRYLPIHDWIVTYGLDYCNIEPTASDISAMNNNKIPPSLLNDEIHFNDYGKQCVAHLVTERLDLLNL